MGYISGVDRRQQVLFPETVDEYVSEDNPVRVIDAFVGGLEMAKLGFARAIPATEGRPSYDPRDLLRLYIYGYLNRTRSSRKLEQETHRNLEVIWLLRKLRPDHKTISIFRREHPEALKRVCREFVVLCKRLDLFEAALAFVDGSKFRAVNNKDRNFTEPRLKKLLELIDERIAEYLSELETQDAREEGQPGVADATLREKLAALEERKQRYLGYRQHLSESGESQLSLTDPESRRMKVRGDMDVCYNAQIAVDAKHHLIVAHEVTDQVNDVEQLAPMAAAAKEALGVQTLEVAADRGYHTGHTSWRARRRGSRRWYRRRRPRRTRSGAATPRRPSPTAASATRTGARPGSGCPPARRRRRRGARCATTPTGRRAVAVRCAPGAHRASRGVASCARPKRSGWRRCGCAWRRGPS
jgi:transposase